MVIIKLWGGLGNQMFQYALHLSFLKKGIVSKLDKSLYGTTNDHNGFEIEKIFKLNAAYSSSIEKILVKLSGKLSHKFFKTPYKETDSMSGAFIPAVAALKKGYLKGYWQTEKYFSDVKDDLRKQFSFRPITDDRNVVVLDKMASVNAVSLHIRRGDYLLNNRNWNIGIDYYKEAVNFIKQKTTDPYFFVFSDDIAWAKENLVNENAVFIDWNKKEYSYIDMQLMSNCQHNIIANSSFSWWGAWLNNHPNKIVIAPDPWFREMGGTRDMIPDNWIRIPN